MSAVSWLTQLTHADKPAVHHESNIVLDSLVVSQTLTNVPFMLRTQLHSKGVCHAFIGVYSILVHLVQ